MAAKSLNSLNKFPFPNCYFDVGLQKAANLNVSKINQTTATPCM